MYVWSAVLVVILAFVSQRQTVKIGHHTCGVERWAVKTMADPSSNKIKPDIQDTTVELLRQQAVPGNLTQTPNERHVPVETTRYRVHALLLGFKEETDSDYHLVLASPTDPSLTMVAEIPSGACSPEALRRQDSSLQFWMLKNFGPKRNVHMAVGRMIKLHPPRSVIVEGVGFFDYLHGQTGVAPNGIELHPVTSITLGK